MSKENEKEMITTTPPPKRRYRYAYNNLGYYSGLCRPIGETALKTPIYPINSTEKEPYWKEGHTPRFSYDINNWILEPKSKRQEREYIDKELEIKIINKLFHRLQEIKTAQEQEYKQVLEVFHGSRNLISAQISNLENLLLELQTQQIQSSNQHHIINQKLALIIKLQNKPTLWQKIKSWFKF